MKTFKFIIEKTKTGYSAFEAKHPIYTSGKTIHDLQYNALVTSNFFLEDEGITITADMLNFEIDLQQFFSFYKVINAKHLASRISMNESLLSQYANGKKKPSKKQVERIIQGLHEIGKELMDITLV